MSEAPSPATAAVLDPPREVPLGRHGVGVARQQDERLPGPSGVDQALAVREGGLQGHVRGHVLAQSRFTSRFRGDVDELERPLRERVIRGWSGHNRGR